MTEHPNVERLRRGYAAYATGDLATLRGLLADGVTLHILGHTPLSGADNGLAEVLGYYARLQESGAAFTYKANRSRPMRPGRRPAASIAW
jgi:ketosteroid isomerase-like protein